MRAQGFRFGFSAAALSFGSTTALHVKGLLTRMRTQGAG